MQRDLIDALVAWKKNPRRKPLILNGARQVGKTWLLKEFGRTYFSNIAYVSLDSNDTARSLFEADFNIKRIIDGLALLTSTQITPEDTLIVLDEIQACPKALTSLKYFCEDARPYAVAAAGSLLGISATTGTGYPVGKVDTLDLYPFSFGEFLDASGESALRTMLEGGDPVSINAFSDRSIQALKGYCVVGGMPEVVETYVQTGDFAEVRSVQRQILQDYERDFAKHVPARLYPRMLEAWASIPSHLAQENKKFVFGRVREGARAKDFEEAITWLRQAGLIQKVPRVTKPGLPLSAYDDFRSFKVFLLDVGLLGTMSELDPRSIVEGNLVFTEFKGALAEQYVCQQLIAACGMRPFYWSASNSSGEVDFLVQEAGAIYAVEVKAEENLQAKSLRAFKQKHPEVRAVRFSLSGYREQDWLVNVPLYAIGAASLWRQG